MMEADREQIGSGSGSKFLTFDSISTPDMIQSNVLKIWASKLGVGGGGGGGGARSVPDRGHTPLIPRLGPLLDLIGSVYRLKIICMLVVKNHLILVVSCVFNTSDILSDVLLLSKVRFSVKF